MDAGRIEQILNNLLSNGLRYTPEGGSLALQLAVKQRQAELSLSDSGPGIPPEALPQLFERFFRVDRARSRQQGGTGLGLAIARQLALAHGGDLKAANRPEGGAVFTFVFHYKNEVCFLNKWGVGFNFVVAAHKIEPTSPLYSFAPR
jgi:signal transduction histidine kinase